MPFLVTIVTSDLSQVLVFTLWWLVAVFVILSQRIGYIDSNWWGRAWRSWAAKAIITTASSIALIVSMVFPRPFRGLGVLEALKRLESSRLKPRKVLVENFFFGAFIYLERRSMAPRIVSIHISDLRRKVESGFGLHNNGLHHDLLPSVFLTAILLGLSTDRWPHTIVE